MSNIVADPAKNTFLQDRPRLGNQYLEDTALRSFLQHNLPPQVLAEIEVDLEAFGERVAGDILRLGQSAEINKPYLDQFDPWGRRVDNIVTCEAWRRLHGVAAEEGIVAIGYERAQGAFSRLYQFSKLYLFAPSSGLYSCPLAMTDGAARVCEVIGDSFMKTGPFNRLISRDPSSFWTSGQWMTEKAGGSDVGAGTETVAVKQPDGRYRLYGLKWFTSATDANMTIALARIQDENGNVVPGSKGLSLFYVEVRDSQGALNHIEVQKLKNKLGTRQLPTAELVLKGTYARLISPVGRGVACISAMLNITRLYNSISAVAAMRRILALARDYAHRRTVFGRRLVDSPLQLGVLAKMEVEVRGSLFLVLDITRLLGKLECGLADKREEDLLRLLTPIAKMFTAKQAMSVVSEGLECFGGQGYIEDTHLPSILRDAQVLPIWEGTTNVQAHDILRAITRSKGSALQAFVYFTTKRIESAAAALPNNECAKVVVNGVNAAVTEIVQFAQGMLKMDLLCVEASSRDLAFTLAHTFIAAILLEHAARTKADTDVTVARRWCEAHPPNVLNVRLRKHLEEERNLALDVDERGVARGHGDVGVNGQIRSKF
eukprot:GILK01004696.1.p1 GENE.GILK01004696.1~~GILK01004696.1.p1  ORF type:complete len:636 (-),score=116.45 GILK01004696.1:183-1988(-)